MDFDFRAFNARVDEAQSFRTGTREFAECVKREGEEAKNSTVVPVPGHRLFQTVRRVQRDRRDRDRLALQVLQPLPRM